MFSLLVGAYDRVDARGEFGLVKVPWDNQINGSMMLDASDHT